jgi:hypothetical protein
MTQPLALDVGNSVQRSFDSFFSYLPNVLGFLIILVVGYIIARLVKAVVNKALQHFRVDETLRNSSAGGFVERSALVVSRRPSSVEPFSG